MKYVEILHQFRQKGINFFSFYDFQRVTGLKYNAARMLLQRYKRKGLLISPKRKYYYFADYRPSDFELANKLYFPSYVSLETVLSMESIIPEVVYAVTSVTSRGTNEFVVENRVFEYHKIKTAAFTGYRKRDGYWIAEPEKAVADYLYFVALGKKSWNDRINLERVDVDKIIKYGRFFKNKKLSRLLRKI